MATETQKYVIIYKVVYFYFYSSVRFSFSFLNVLEQAFGYAAVNKLNNRMREKRSARACSIRRNIRVDKKWTVELGGQQVCASRSEINRVFVKKQVGGNDRGLAGTFLFRS